MLFPVLWIEIEKGKEGPLQQCFFLGMDINMTINMTNMTTCMPHNMPLCTSHLHQRGLYFFRPCS
jgi:hypothetical protein